MDNFYSILLHDASGNTLDWSAYEGKKIMFVNVASECGFTPQYAQLQELYESSKERMEIIGIPCNDFGGQEPGTAKEVVTFCQKNYGVEFTISEKVKILSNPHPLYKWLMLEAKKVNQPDEVKWNFHKFLMNEDRSVEMSLSSGVSPFDEQIMDWLDIK